MASHRLRTAMFPSGQWLKDLYAEVMALPNVSGCYIGRCQVAGRERGLGLICTVGRKVDEGDLPAGGVIAKEYQLNYGKKKFRIKTDVVEVGQSGPFSTLFAGPGDRQREFRRPNRAPVQASATIGIAIRHPRFGVIITTAGHALLSRPNIVIYQRPRPLVLLHNIRKAERPTPFRAQALKAVWTPVRDYTLLRPHPSFEAANFYHDVLPLENVKTVVPEEVGTMAFVLTARGRKRTRIVGIRATIRVGPLRVRDAILTELVTREGDSGCALIDRERRVIGVLSGFSVINGKAVSVFTNPVTLLQRERATML